jgi:UDP-2-acetamido-2,6-beta-L-arabino-hexul-4-ose reductase
MKLEISKVNVKIDERGLLAEMVKKGKLNGEIKEVLLITSRPGVVRGNHYHKSKDEVLCIIKGRAKFVYEDIRTGKRKELTVSGKVPVVIRTPKNVAHAIKNIGKEDLYLLEISNQIYEEKPDTFKKEIM